MFLLYAIYLDMSTIFLRNCAKMKGMKDPVFLEVFNELLDENSINRSQFSEKSGIPYSTVVGWTKLGRLPDYEALIRIASFFDCSLDYLMTKRSDFGHAKYSVELRSDEQTLLKHYRKLSDENKEHVLCLMEALNGAGNNRTRP